MSIRRTLTNKLFEAAVAFLSSASSVQPTAESAGRLHATVSIGYLVLAAVAACMDRQKNSWAMTMSSSGLLERARATFESITTPSPAQTALFCMYWQAVPGAPDCPEGDAKQARSKCAEEVKGKRETAKGFSRLLFPTMPLAYSNVPEQDDLAVDRAARKLLTHAETSSHRGKIDQVILDDLRSAVDALNGVKRADFADPDVVFRHARLCQIAMSIEVRHGSTKSVVDRLPMMQIANAADQIWATPFGRPLLLQFAPLYEVYCRSLAARKEDNGAIAETSVKKLRVQTIRLLELLVGPVQANEVQSEGWLDRVLMKIDPAERIAVVRCLVLFARVLAHGSVREFNEPPSQRASEIPDLCDLVYRIAADYLLANWNEHSFNNAVMIAGPVASAEVRCSEVFPSIQVELWNRAMSTDPASHPGSAAEPPLLWPQFNQVVVDLLETSALSVREYAHGHDWFDLLDHQVAEKPEGTQS